MVSRSGTLVDFQPRAHFLDEGAFEVAALISRDDVGIAEGIDECLEAECDRDGLLVGYRVSFDPFSKVVGDDEDVSFIAI